MDENDKSYEPMDIDLSSHSVSAMDISYVETNIDSSMYMIKADNIKKEVVENVISEKCLNIKPLNINNLIAKQTQNRNQKQTCSKQVFKCLSYISVLFLSVLIYQVAQFKCSEKLDISSLRHTLESRVYGQTTATKTLNKALESEVARKIIILYGGTGVGKTFTSSIIIENLLHYGNIYHYTMPGFMQTSTDLMFGLIFCKSSLIIVDDLRTNDILNIEHIIKDLISKSEKNSKNITIMLVYNTDSIDEKFYQKHDDDFLLKLQQSLWNIDAQKYYIKFNSLTEDHLRKCIKSEFPEKEFSESEMLNLMKNFNVKTDGCKGVYQKMKYLSIV